MNLFKAFDCVPHDFLLVKLAAYGVDESFLCYIYLTSKSETVRVNQ